MTVLYIGIAYVLVVSAGVFIAVGLFMAARRGDDEADRAMRREQERRDALNRISGGSGWRGR